MKDKIVLVTSIAPNGIKNQQKAIASWVRQGFQIISCNVEEEISLLVDKFPDVEFVKVNRDSRNINGKPCPYIYDMLQVLKQSGKKIGGIVNSDIHLKYFSEKMYEYLYEQASEALLFLRRQEVISLSKEDERKGSVFFGGIDTFFFPIKNIDLLEDDGLILGQAMWDYWFPIMLSEHGIRLKELVNPITFHIAHATRWDDRLTEGISDYICKKHFHGVKREDAVEFLKDKFFTVISSADGQVCYLPEQWTKKSVMIHGANLDEKNKKRIQKSRLHITFDQKEWTNVDYQIEIPYRTEMSASFVEAAIWTMETWNLGEMQIPIYWRGNRTNTVVMENCNVLLRDRFNREIQPIVMYRVARGKRDMKKRKSCFPMCIATVFIEEDERVIWEREKTGGRVLLFPAGFMARKWVKKYRSVAEEIELIGWIDNNEKLWHSSIYGMPVFNPKEILNKKESYDKIFIISNLYAKEIYNYLKTDVPEEKIIIWNEYDGKKWSALQRDMCRGKNDGIL